MNISLVSMPWRLPNSAAIGLASLKSVARDAGASSCAVHYFNDLWFHSAHVSEHLPAPLRIPDFTEFSRMYSDLAGVIHAGEWFFAGTLYGDAVPDRERYAAYFERASEHHEYSEFARSFVESSGLVDDFLAGCERILDWRNRDVIGFSCVFYQLVPSLALAHRIRAAGYQGKIVFGGPLCEGDVGKQLLESFSFVDAVFDGEAEQSFGQFTSAVVKGEAWNTLAGIWTRGPDGTGSKPKGRSGIQNLDDIPYPDYSDFFSMPGMTELMASGQIAFPLEGSRGCWWGEKHHCVFCGLNGADMSYRVKSHQRILGEVRRFQAEYGAKFFAFTDNIVSQKVMKPLFRELAEKPLPIFFLAEIKSNLNRRQVQEYRKAGFLYLQPGIESLSSAVLKIIDKGVSGLHNIACLKFCREAGVNALWNLLYGFPGESEKDFADIAALLPAIVHLASPEMVTPMRLTRFSPSFYRSEALGFHNKAPAGYFTAIFPLETEELANLVNTFDFEFQDTLDRESLIRPICNFIADWRGRGNNTGTLIHDANGGGRNRPALVDTRYTRKGALHHLSALEDFIYTVCDTPTSMEAVMAALQKSEQWKDTVRETVDGILATFVDHLLMVRDGDRFLNVAMSDSTFIAWQGRADIKATLAASAMFAGVPMFQEAFV